MEIDFRKLGSLDGGQFATFGVKSARVVSGSVENWLGALSRSSGARWYLSSWSLTVASKWLREVETRLRGVSLFFAREWEIAGYIRSGAGVLL